MTYGGVSQLDKQKFGFNQTQIGGTKYHLVKDYPVQIIIKESNYEAGANFDFRKGKNFGNFDL